MSVYADISFTGERVENPFTAKVSAISVRIYDQEFNDTGRSTTIEVVQENTARADYELLQFLQSVDGKGFIRPVVRHPRYDVILLERLFPVSSWYLSGDAVCPLSILRFLGNLGVSPSPSGELGVESLRGVSTTLKNLTNKEVTN